MDSGDLQALCEELLSASIEALDTLPAPLLGAPDHAFVSPGQPALDCCDQLTVHAVTISDAIQQGGLEQGKHDPGNINYVGLVVTITRCIPSTGPKGEIPEVSALSAAAEQLNGDAWALWNHLWNMKRSGTLFTLCGNVVWDGMRSVPPQGGCAGWTLSLRIRLDGYQEAESS